MQRHCDGTDQTTMKITDAGERVEVGSLAGDKIVSCDCGKRFDDTELLTTWPHLSIPPDVVFEPEQPAVEAEI